MPRADYHNSTSYKRFCIYIRTYTFVLTHVDYIVLENVVTNFEHPSILDLKLGTQSHSDVMTEAKQKLHMERCASTTSESLGVRFSGMQVCIRTYVSRSVCVRPV